MAEDAGVGVLEGAKDAGGHLFDGLVEVAVDAGDHDVHLGEGGVVEVEGAVGEDVDFNAGEDAEVQSAGSVRSPCPRSGTWGTRFSGCIGKVRRLRSA